MSTHGIRGPLEPQIERYRTINNPSVGSTYTLNSDDTRYYDGSGLQSLYCGAIYHFSDGTKTADTYIMIILA